MNHKYDKMIYVTDRQITNFTIVNQRLVCGTKYTSSFIWILCQSIKYLTIANSLIDFP